MLLAFLGDIFWGDDTDWVLSEELKSILDNADIVIANLESPVTSCDFDYSDKIVLRSSANTVGLLNSLGIDVVSLANNHIFDTGWDGFKETVEGLDNIGVGHFGAGENLNEVMQPFFF